MAYSTDPDDATPTWTTDAAITDIADQIERFEIGKDASGNDVIYCATNTWLLAHDFTNTIWTRTAVKLPDHPNGGKGFAYWHDGHYLSYGLGVKRYVTGSTATGQLLAEQAGRRLIGFSAELGGKNAVVINDVDDLDSCLDQVAGAAFMCAGQRCTAISRVIVAEALRPTVEAGLVKRAEAQKQGDGREVGVTIGPLTNKAQFARVQSMVKMGAAEGATLLTGGKPSVADPDKEGYFFAPTIMSSISPDMRVAREEIFGPVIGISPYATLDEAFDILNNVEYGLTSSLFSKDFGVIQRFVAESESGMLHVNHGTIPDNHMPFGGIKNSGVGAYSVGASAANFYTTEHSVYLKAQ